MFVTSSCLGLANVFPCTNNPVTTQSGPNRAAKILGALAISDTLTTITTLVLATLGVIGVIPHMPYAASYALFGVGGLFMLTLLITALTGHYHSLAGDFLKDLFGQFEKSGR